MLGTRSRMQRRRRHLHMLTSSRRRGLLTAGSLTGSRQLPHPPQLLRRLTMWELVMGKPHRCWRCSQRSSWPSHRSVASRRRALPQQQQPLERTPQSPPQAALHHLPTMLPALRMSLPPPSRPLLAPTLILCRCQMHSKTATQTASKARVQRLRASILTVRSRVLRSQNTATHHRRTCTRHAAVLRSPSVCVTHEVLSPVACCMPIIAVVQDLLCGNA